MFFPAKIHSNYLQNTSNDQYRSPIYKLDFPIFNKSLHFIFIYSWPGMPVHET